MSGMERLFQRWVVKQWERTGRWGENVHPSMGMKAGFPDVLLMASGLVVPIEVKLGRLVDTGLKVSEIRPAQVRWSNRFTMNGGKCGLIVGIKNHEAKTNYADDAWSIAVVKNRAWWNNKKTYPESDFIIADDVTKAVSFILSQ